jgi:glycosyltransferase involved in cell wall biosynthesis
LRDIFRTEGSVLFLQAGAWLVNSQEFRVPHPSATGKPLCAVGATRTPAEFDPARERCAASWNAFFSRSGGEFSGSATLSVAPCAIYLDALATRVLGQQGATSLQSVLQLAQAEFRLVHYAPLDVYEDHGLRLLKVITSLQRGGAERVALDLMAELRRLNTRAHLVTLGRAVRDAFPAPAGTHDLSKMSHETRHAELVRIAIKFGADVVHGHLLSRENIRAISAARIPLALTVHNTRSGWPAGLADLAEDDADLLIPCARAVEADLKEAKLASPIRTVRNGISIGDFQPTPERLAAGRLWRVKWGFDENDFVLIAVANPRPQKRLQLLPAILAALRNQLEATLETGSLTSATERATPIAPFVSNEQRVGGAIGVARFHARQARLVFVGEVLRGNSEAERCLAETQSEIARLGLEQHVRWTGPVANVAEVLAAADVLVSTSAHEGLSLAQLEALAMGCAVVATDVGGAAEIARDNSQFHLLSADATAEEFAEALARPNPAARFKQSGENFDGSPDVPDRSLSLDWSRQRMASRYRWLFPRAIAAARQRRKNGSGLWLIANNFSTGGAQSSARRLLLGLHSQGVRVRAAVVEEDPAYPTLGRRILVESGIPVIAPPLDGDGQHEAAIEQLLAAIDADPPQSVLFWNLRPSFKVALADALLNTAIFDVSPGEMYYDSFDKYFEKPIWRFGCRMPQDYGALLAGVIVKYRAEADQARSYLGAPVHVIPNGVPSAPVNGLTERNGHGGSKSAVVFGTAARINPQKRLEDLLEAFHMAHDRLPHYVLKIAGGVERDCDEYAARLRAGCNGLSVQWLGEVTDVPAFHRELDAFAMISEPAGCPNASLEAIAAGLPVIATDFGGASEQVIDGLNGRLVPVRNPAAFADALVELATQRESRCRMGLAGTELIRERFSIERMIGDYRRICLSRA